MAQRTSRKRQNPIRIKPKNQGKMRKTTGTKAGRKVPLSKLRKLANSKNPLTRRRAVFAINAKTKWNKGGGGRRRRR